ncbi:MAG: hypothetical protein J7493_12965 [Porphyrobacter sp.]|nr:hypothetical protein [Porphyrobacter sp.]
MAENDYRTWRLDAPVKITDAQNERVVRLLVELAGRRIPTLYPRLAANSGASDKGSAIR